MRVVTVLAATAAFAFAIPALAQQGGASSGSSRTGQTASPGSSSAQTSTPSSGGAANAMTQQALRQSLEQAGFQDIEVLDAAYLVQARTKDGDEVTMMINPPSAGTAASGSSTSGSGQGSGASSSPTGSSSTSSGSNQNRSQ